MKLRRTMKAQNLKRRKKERNNNNNNNNNKEKRRGSRSGQRTCSKDPDQRICSKKSSKTLGT